MSSGGQDKRKGLKREDEPDELSCESLSLSLSLSLLTFPLTRLSYLHGEGFEPTHPPNRPPFFLPPFQLPFLLFALHCAAVVYYSLCMWHTFFFDDLFSLSVLLMLFCFLLFLRCRYWTSAAERKGESPFKV